MDSELRAYILCRFADQSGIYTSWMDECPIPITIVDEYLPDWCVPPDAGILITHMHYRWEDLTILRNAMERDRVPVLILSDGVLEYRNTWEHPDLVDGSLYQPLFGHKLACIGRSQARVVESWGNVGRCEVVGMPRFDSVSRSNVPPQSTGPFRILVATATTPAFDAAQRATVVESLNQLKTWFANHTSVHQRPIELEWRLSDGLDSELGLASDGDPESRPPLDEVLDRVDAVITSPSTLYLESLLRRRPTAVLDFHNRPQYVPSAWSLTSSDQIGPIVNELANPPRHKMLYQESVLLDQLECQTPARPRLIELIEKMVAAGRVARAERIPIELPPRILTDPQSGFSSVPESFDLASLYADQAVFHQQDVDRLKIELAAAVQRLGQLPSELAEKSQTITQLMRTLDRTRLRVEEMHNRVVSIRKRFGVQPTPSVTNGPEIIDQG